MERRVAAVDMGINNFICMTNNVGDNPVIVKGGALKSMYTYYQTEKKRLQEELTRKQPGRECSKRLSNLSRKYHNKVTDWLIQVSKIVTQHCDIWNVDTLIVGDGGMNTVNDYEQCMKGEENILFWFMAILKKQCQKMGITVIVVDESYTTGTSFLDGEHPNKQCYDNTRNNGRLFCAGDGSVINGDVNASYQIMKKVYPELFGNDLSMYELQPVICRIRRDGTIRIGEEGGAKHGKYV